jgi:hypothetical protein
MHKLIDLITCRKFTNPFFVLNGIYFNLFLLLLIVSLFNSLVLKNIKLGNQLFEFSMYPFLIMLLNTTVMAFYVTFSKRKNLMEDRPVEKLTSHPRGKTPLKIIADNIAKGMVKNLNSDYQSKH